MKVGLDISQLAFSGGVVTYTKNLAKNLNLQKNIEMIFFYASLRKPYQDDLPNVKSFLLPSSLMELLFNRLRFPPIETFLGEVDIFHSSDWTQPPTKSKKVTTYHDLTPLKYPDWSHPKIVEVNRRRIKIVEKEVDKVIAVSENTKRDLLELSNIAKDRISVIYEGVGEEFMPRSEDVKKELKEKLGLPERFVLAIGGVGKRRNLDRIKEAAKDYNLIITSETIPLLDDKDMSVLYSAASILLYPSLYEGFGLPVLEAMASGLPVITSNTSSLPEVGGDAAVYVDPQNIADIKKNLDLVMQDDQKRAEMIKKGALQAKKFSWQKCALETSSVYFQLMEGK